MRSFREYFSLRKCVMALLGSAILAFGLYNVHAFSGVTEGGVLGLTLLFAAFGLMSLLVLIIWAIDPQYRLYVMIATTAVLLLSSLIGGIWTLRKARRSTFLRLTRKELAEDRALLEDERL